MPSSMAYLTTTPNTGKAVRRLSMSSTQGVDELKNEPWFPSLSRRTLLGFLVSAWSTRSGFSSTNMVGDLERWRSWPGHAVRQQRKRGLSNQKWTNMYNTFFKLNLPTCMCSYIRADRSTDSNLHGVTDQPERRISRRGLNHQKLTYFGLAATLR
nr:uncharacterized protein LOC127310785 [Lolium perenne]